MRDRAFRYFPSRSYSFLNPHLHKTCASQVARSRRPQPRRPFDLFISHSALGSRPPLGPQSKETVQPGIDTHPQHDSQSKKLQNFSALSPRTHFADGPLTEDKARPRLHSDQTQTQTNEQETLAHTIVHSKDHESTSHLTPTVVAIKKQAESTTKPWHKRSAVTMADLTTSDQPATRASDMFQSSATAPEVEKNSHPSAEELELELRALSASLREVRYRSVMVGICILSSFH